MFAELGNEDGMTNAMKERWVKRPSRSFTIANTNCTPNYLKCSTILQDQ